MFLLYIFCKQVVAGMIMMIMQSHYHSIMSAIDNITCVHHSLYINRNYLFIYESEDIQREFTHVVGGPAWRLLVGIYQPGVLTI